MDQEIAELVSYINPGEVAVSKRGYVDGRIRNSGRDDVTGHQVKKEVSVTERPLSNGWTDGIVVVDGSKVKKMVLSGERRTEVV